MRVQALTPSGTLTPWLRSQGSACGPFTPMRGRQLASVSMTGKTGVIARELDNGWHAMELVPAWSLVDEQIVQRAASEAGGHFCRSPPAS